MKKAKTKAPSKAQVEKVRAALAHFKKSDPKMYAAAHSLRTHLVSRSSKRRDEKRLFEALCESVVSQQLAVKAADAIWARVVLACGGEVTQESISKARLPRLRAAGLSGAKAKTLKELAKAVGAGLSLSSLRKLGRIEAEERLTEVWGIGPWTTEMFLLFALEHPDIFSSRDLGLIRSMEAMYRVKKDSPRSVYEKIALRWAPHRSLASIVLWRMRDAQKI